MKAEQTRTAISGVRVSHPATVPNGVRVCVRVYGRFEIGETRTPACINPNMWFPPHPLPDQETPFRGGLRTGLFGFRSSLAHYCSTVAA